MFEALLLLLWLCLECGFLEIYIYIVVESMYVLVVSLWQYTDFEQDISSETRLDSRECSNNL